MKWDFVMDQMWENPTQSGSEVLWAGGKGSSVPPGLFPAARGSCAGDVGQAGSVGFSQHTQTSQLKALAMIHFTPVCKDFMSAFSSHRFQLWFGVCFILLLSILSCAGGNSQLDAEAVKLVGWEFSSALGSAFSSRAGLGKDLVAVPTSLPAGQTGETGTGLGQLLGSRELLLSQLQLLSECPPRDGNPPALLILNITRRCKSRLTFSFRNCHLFSELLASVRDRNPLPAWVLFQFTVRGKDWGALSCFCWGVQRRNSLRVIVKLKVQKVFF